MRKTNFSFLTLHPGKILNRNLKQFCSCSKMTKNQNLKTESKHVTKPFLNQIIKLMRRKTNEVVNNKLFKIRMKQAPSQNKQRNTIDLIEYAS